MKNTLLKLNKEDGDFNINLLIYYEDIVVQEFYNLMTSNDFIPQITLPYLTDSTMTLIDNIYSNMFLNNTFSGSIIIEIADHLLQFVGKYLKCYERNYQNFSEESFIADITVRKWYNDFKNVNDSYNDFIFRLEGCVNRHAPIK